MAESNTTKGFRYRIRNDSDETVIDTLRPTDTKYFDVKDLKASQSSDFFRYGRSVKNGFVIEAIADNKDYLNSSKTFKKQMDFVLGSMQFLEKDLQAHYQNVTDRTNRLIHNLVTLNAKNIQQIASIVPVGSFSGDAKTIIDTIKNSIESDLKLSAIATLKVAKNNTAIKGEISVFEKLYKQRPLLSKKKHVMHKVFMNAYYPFAPDFIDKNVKVKIQPSDCRGYFDYESIQVALIHLLENATKYTLPDSVMHVRFTNDAESVSIYFEMQSLRIHPDEQERIFQEGYSGQFAAGLSTAGTGAGLFIAKKVLELNEGALVISSDSKNPVDKMGILYDHNTVELTIPKARDNNR